MDDLRNDIITLIQQIRYEEWKKSTSIDLKHKSVIRARIEDHVAFCDYLIDCIGKIDSAKPIEYEECSNAMLRMWMDGVVTDGEYNNIMDKLNKHWGRAKEGGQDGKTN